MCSLQNGKLGGKFFKIKAPEFLNSFVRQAFLVCAALALYSKLQSSQASKLSVAMSTIFILILFKDTGECPRHAHDAQSWQVDEDLTECGEPHWFHHVDSLKPAKAVLP